MRRKFWTLISIAALCGIWSVAYAGIIVDDAGVGFVGKGDVQLLFGWNNAALQDCAKGTGCLEFDFDSESVVVTERSWICTNSNNQNTQERERTTTTTTTTGGLVASVARVKNQVTGFNLTGGDLDSVFPPPTTVGPQPNSCPGGPWTLTTPAGDPVEVSNEATRTLTITDTRNGNFHTVDLD
jgi:hypothetical protein